MSTSIRDNRHVFFVKNKLKINIEKCLNKFEIKKVKEKKNDDVKQARERGLSKSKLL